MRREIEVDAQCKSCFEIITTDGEYKDGNYVISPTRAVSVVGGEIRHRCGGKLSWFPPRGLGFTHIHVQNVVIDTHRNGNRPKKVHGPSRGGMRL